MGIFNIPLNLCNNLEKLMNGFWWGPNSSNQGGIRWMAYGIISSKKSEEGFGLKKQNYFNLALFVKRN